MRYCPFKMVYYIIKWVGGVEMLPLILNTEL